MIQLQVDQKRLEKTIDLVVDKTFGTDLTWDWPCGVAFYGIARAYEVTKKSVYMEKLAAWVDNYIALGLPDWTVNTCAMGHCLLTLYEVTAEDRYLEIIDSKLDYLQNKALRFGESVLQHTVSVKNDFPEQCWADTLFMAAYFMLRAGVKFQRQELIEDALNQYFWHIEFLQDKTNGLWYHGYDHVAQDHMSGFYWARANAWAAYTMSRVQKILPQPYLYPTFMDIDCSLRDQLSQLRLLQMENGLWHTILDDLESYGEVSATAGIAAAMINGGNPLHGDAAQRALDQVLTQISPEGKVMNVSGGTAVMKDREGYRNVPKRWLQGWGQGLALVLLADAWETVPD